VNGSDPSGENDGGVALAQQRNNYVEYCRANESASACGSCPPSVSNIDCAVMNWDPAYAAIAGTYNAYEAAQNPCSSNWTIAGDSFEALLGVVATVGVSTGVAGAVDGALDGAAAQGGVNIEDANFAQTSAGEAFQDEGNYAGQTITGMANELRSGSLSPADVPIQVAVVDGNTLIINTRSASALEEAGIPRAAWTLENVTNDPAAMQNIEARLAHNGLTSTGTPTVRITGRG
jgi:hypothetical protein